MGILWKFVPSIVAWAALTIGAVAIEMLLVVGYTLAARKTPQRSGTPGTPHSRWLQKLLSFLPGGAPTAVPFSERVRKLLQEDWVHNTAFILVAAHAPFMSWTAGDFLTALATGAFSIAAAVFYAAYHRDWLDKTKDYLWGAKAAHAVSIALAVGLSLLALKFGKAFWAVAPEAGPRQKALTIILSVFVFYTVAYAFKWHTKLTGKVALGAATCVALTLAIALLSGWDMSSVDGVTKTAWKHLSSSFLLPFVLATLVATLVGAGMYKLGKSVAIPVTIVALLAGLALLWHFELLTMPKFEKSDIVAKSADTVEKRTSEAPTIEKWVGQPTQLFSANFDDLSEEQKKAELESWPAVAFHNSTARETEPIRVPKASPTKFQEVALWDAEDVIMTCLYNNGRAPESFRWVGGRICTRDNMYAFTLKSERDDAHKVPYAFRKKAAAPNS